MFHPAALLGLLLGCSPWSEPPPQPTAALPQAITPTPIDAPAPPLHTVPAAAAPPNIVLIIGCTVRKDQTSVYGGPANVTPFLASLAQRGTTFDDTIAAAPWTRAASTSILTGWYGMSIGITDPGSGTEQRRIPDGVTTLAEHLKARGYTTLGAYANPNLSAEFGFDQGFDVYQPGISAAWDKTSGADVVDALLEALKANRATGDTRPFYLRAILIDAHGPRSAEGDQLLPYGHDGVPTDVAQYRYHLNQLDSALSRLDHGLSTLGFDASNTLFVVVSDHGEGLNYPKSHGRGHGQVLSSSATHAVWVLAGPGVSPGHRIRGVSSQTDILPTLLGLTGLPHQGPSDGQDWSALVRGEGGITTAQQAWSDTWFMQVRRSAIFTPTRQCQQDYSTSISRKQRDRFEPGCFDRHADPLFTRPFSDRSLLDRLGAWRNERLAQGSTWGASPATVSPALSRELSALGYVQ